MYEDSDMIGEAAVLNNPYLGNRTDMVVRYFPVFGSTRRMKIIATS